MIVSSGSIFLTSWLFVCLEMFHLKSGEIMGEGVGCSRKFHTRGSALGSKPLPFHVPFLTEKVTISCAFHRKWPLFHILTVEIRHFFSVGLFATDF